jgi:hypothetical protein
MKNKVKLFETWVFNNVRFFATRSKELYNHYVIIDEDGNYYGHSFDIEYFKSLQKYSKLEVKAIVDKIEIKLQQ